VLALRELRPRLVEQTRSTFAAPWSNQVGHEARDQGRPDERRALARR
jgi:hypothetical protein